MTSPGMAGRTLLLGGARSGKSAMAQSMAQAAARRGQEVCVIVTATAGDDEMARRIERHRRDRPAGWRVVEAPLRLPEAIRFEAREGRFVVVDCLTLWLSNLLVDGRAAPVEALCDAVSDSAGELVLVSNETGLGVVPMGALSRDFVDTSGELHQALARRCDAVALLVAGLPLWLKGNGPDAGVESDDE